MKKFTTIILFSFLLLTGINFAKADCSNTSPAGAKTDGAVQICNPLESAGIDTPQKLIGNVIKALIGVIGSLALVMFVYGGFTWMTSAGEKTKVQKGRDTMLWAVLGLAVVFSSYALVRFVIEKVAT